MLDPLLENFSISFIFTPHSITATHYDLYHLSIMAAVQHTSPSTVNVVDVEKDTTETEYLERPSTMDKEDASGIASHNVHLPPNEQYRL